MELRTSRWVRNFNKVFDGLEIIQTKVPEVEFFLRLETGIFRNRVLIQLFQWITGGAELHVFDSTSPS